jgi:hypothetical protein
MLIAPKRKPQEFGFKAGDTHLVVNAESETMKAYDFSGKLLFEVPCLAMGLTADWRANSGDTPPGLYRLGQIYRDFNRYGSKPDYDRMLIAFGWCSIDLVDLEGNEDGNGRAGLMIHGGGTACGWPGAWEPKQQLFNTLGCLRMHNTDLQTLVLPLALEATVYVSVWQDDQ